MEHASSAVAPEYAAMSEHAMSVIPASCNLQDSSIAKSSDRDKLNF
jgi:hypothetical protein